MFKQYRKIEQGEFFVIGCDTASGGLDYSTAQFISKTHLDVPLVYHSKQTTTQMTNDLVPVLEKIHDITDKTPVIAYERNNGGAFEMDRLAQLNRLNKYRIYMEKTGIGATDQPIQKKLGWTTSTATRPKMLEDLKNAVDNKVLRIYDETTINEMFAFIIEETTTAWRAIAEQGAHDDLIIALAIAWQLYQTESPPAEYTQVPNQWKDTQWKIGV